MNRKSLSILKLSTTENSYLSNKPKKNRVSFSNIKKVRLIENPRQKIDQTYLGSDKELSLTSEESLRNSFTETASKNLFNRSVNLKNIKKHKLKMAQNRGNFKNQDFSLLNLTDTNIEIDNVKPLKSVNPKMDDTFQLSDDSSYEVKENIPLKRRKIEILDKSYMNTSMYDHDFSENSKDNVNIFKEKSQNCINNDSQDFVNFLDETFIDTSSKLDQRISNDYRKINIEPIEFENSSNKSFSICENIMDMSMIDKIDRNIDGFNENKFINHEFNNLSKETHNISDFEYQLNTRKNFNSVDENNISMQYENFNKSNLFNSNELVRNESLSPNSVSIIKEDQFDVATSQKESISDISFNIDFNTSNVDCTKNLQGNSQTDIDWSVSQFNVINKENANENSYLKIKSYEISSTEDLDSTLGINYSIQNVICDEESIVNLDVDTIEDSNNFCQQLINVEQLDLSNNRSINERNEFKNVSLHDNKTNLDISFIPNENELKISVSNTNKGDSIKLIEQGAFLFNDLSAKANNTITSICDLNWDNSISNISMHNSKNQRTADAYVIQQSNIINSEQSNILTSSDSKCLHSIFNISEIPKDNDNAQCIEQSSSLLDISCIPKDDSLKINYTDEFDFNASNVNKLGEPYSDRNKSIFPINNIEINKIDNIIGNLHPDSTDTEQIEKFESPSELIENSIQFSKYKNDNLFADNQSAVDLNVKLKNQDVNSSLSKEEFINWTFNKTTYVEEEEEEEFSNHSINMNESLMNDESSSSNDNDFLNKAVFSINTNDSLCDISGNLNESSNMDCDLQVNLCRDSLSEETVQLNLGKSNLSYNNCNESIQRENINSSLNRPNNFENENVINENNCLNVTSSIFQLNDLSVFQTNKDNNIDKSSSEYSQQFQENECSADITMLNDSYSTNISCNGEIVEKELTTKIPSSSIINFSSIESNIFHSKGFDEMSSIENIRNSQSNSPMDSFCNFTFDVNSSLSYNHNYNLENTESVKICKSNQFVTPKNACINRNMRGFSKTTTLSDIFLTPISYPVSSDIKFTPLFPNKNIFSLDALIPVNSKQIDINISWLDEKCSAINSYYNLNENLLETNQKNLNSIINIKTKPLERNIHPEICRIYMTFIGNPILELMNFYKQFLHKLNTKYKVKYDLISNLKSKMLSKCRICQRKQLCSHYSELKNLQQDVFTGASGEYDLIVTSIRRQYDAITKMGFNSMKVEISRLNFKMKKSLQEKQAKSFLINLNNEMQLMENRVKKSDILISTLLKMKEIGREKEIYLKSTENQKADYYRFIINSKINPLREVFITNNVTKFLLMGSRVNVVAKIRNETADMYIESASVTAHESLYPMKANIEQYFQKLIEQQLINCKTSFAKEKFLDYQMPVLLLLGDVNLCASLKKFVITFDRNQPFKIKSQIVSRSPLARFAIFIDLNPISTYQHRPLQYQIQIDYNNVEESKIKQILNTTNHGLNKLYRLFENIDKALPDIVLQ